MQVIESEVVGGDRKPVGGFPSENSMALFVGSNFSNRFLCYEESDNQKRAGHENWILAPYRSSNVLSSDVLPYLENEQISGIVWTVLWRTLEPTEGSYSWTLLDSLLSKCQELGKKCIVRVFAKTYSGGFSDPAGAIPVAGNMAVPDYIASDNATYGGAAFRGGIYPVYLSGSPVGWGAQFENTAVLNRWKALVSAARARIGGNEAFHGWIGPDESTRSAWTGSALPSGISFATVSAANREIYEHDLSEFGAAKCWPCINYIDNTATPATANDQTIAEQVWAAQQGLNVAYSDTFPMPDTANAFMQPVYWSDVRASMASGRKILVHVDGLSLGANDSGLTSRMYRCAIQTYRLGADITAWAYWSSNSTDRAAYWAAQLEAMSSTG